MFRLAEIELYRGRFTDAREHAREGLGLARSAGITAVVCRWTKLLAEIEYFSGNVEAAAALVAEALASLFGVPGQERDLALLAALLQNDALVHEAPGGWEVALGRQEQALEIRRETEDARGAAQSLHGIGKALCGLDRLGEAEHILDEGACAVDGLGEHLLRAKITHTLADVRIAQDRLEDAAELTGQALEQFGRHGTPYDVASAQLTLAVIAGRQGSCVRAAGDADQARSAIEAGGYRVLYRLFPAQDVPSAGRIRAGLVAFAAGNALGVPWEGQRPEQIDLGQVTDVPARAGWPRGATSDDTAQLLLGARHLVSTGGKVVAAEFLADLVREFPAMRGTGPTTRAAVARYQQGGPVHAADGDTNGALMRILPAGWAIPASDAGRRREAVTQLTRVTHGAPVAAGCACAVAAMASYALEGCPARELAGVAVDELGQVLAGDSGAEDWVRVVRAAAGESWRPGAGGVRLHAGETLAAVVHVLAACGDDLGGRCGTRSAWAGTPTRSRRSPAASWAAGMLR